MTPPPPCPVEKKKGRESRLCREGRPGQPGGDPAHPVQNPVRGVRPMCDQLPEPVAKEALRRAIHKLPMKCKVVKREAGE